MFFTPAEVDFLFAAPFSRRELLLYKLAKSGLAVVIISAFFALMMQMSLRSLAAGFVGVLLSLTMIQLVGMTAALASQIVTESAYTRTRQLVLLAAAILVLAGLADALRHVQGRPLNELLAGLRTAPFLAVVLAPFRVFTRGDLRGERVPRPGRLGDRRAG